MLIYETNVKWKGGREGVLETGGDNSMEFSSPPEYGGTEGLITPEQLFVASENACYLMTYIAFVEKMRIDLVSFECEAIGYLEKAEKGSVFTKMELKPRIVLKSEEDLEKARKAAELVEKYCFVQNSIRTKVEVNPEITVAE